MEEERQLAQQGVEEEVCHVVQQWLVVLPQQLQRKRPRTNQRPEAPLQDTPIPYPPPQPPSTLSSHNAPVCRGAWPTLSNSWQQLFTGCVVFLFCGFSSSSMDFLLLLCFFLLLLWLFLLFLWVSLIFCRGHLAAATSWTSSSDFKSSRLSAVLISACAAFRITPRTPTGRRSTCCV